MLRPALAKSGRVFCSSMAGFNPATHPVSVGEPKEWMAGSEAGHGE